VVSLAFLILRIVVDVSPSTDPDSCTCWYLLTVSAAIRLHDVIGASDKTSTKKATGTTLIVLGNTAATTPALLEDHSGVNP
jgi:hypothetical protein